MSRTSIPGTKPEEATPRVVRAQRPRFPFFAKLLLLTGVLVVIVTGLSVGLTVSRAQEVATTEVDRSIRDAADLFGEFQQTRLRQLELGVTTIGNDVPFVGYMQDALYRQESAVDLKAEAATASDVPAEEVSDVTDYASIFDQLQQRQRLLNTDLLILTDDQGYLVARTDEARLTGSAAEPVDLYEQQPMLKRIVDGEAEIASGVILLEGRLYHAAAGPLSIGATRVVAGYVVNAFAIDDRFANMIAATTKAGVLFLGASRDGEATISVRSTDAPRADEVMRLSEMSALSSGTRLEVQNVNIAGGEYVMTGESLVSADQPVGSAIFVRSLEEELAPFREIERTLIVTGGLALVLAFLLSWLIARRMTRPVEELARIAQAVTEGDYSVYPDIQGRDEVGILSRSFAQMISALRDKADLEQLYAELTATSEAGSARRIEPTLEKGAVLVTDLRSSRENIVDSGASALIQQVETLLNLQSSEIARQDGAVIGVVGQQVVSLFPGERGVIRAIRASRAIVEEVSLLDSIDAAHLRVAAGIATGDVVRGSVVAGDVTGLAIAGGAATMAMMFAWEAPGDHAFVALDAAQMVGSEILAASAQERIHGATEEEWIPVVSVPLRALTTSMMRSPTGISTASIERTLKLEAEAATASSELRPGQLFAGRYKIEKTLGRGGMGVVYRAHDQQLDEPVAIKVFQSEIMMRSPEELDRFKREIRLARRITHRNVLRTYDYGESDGVYFISMEFIRGYTLAELLDQTSGITPRNAMTITRQICRGLQAAHDEGIIHRDIKPQNVLIDHRGEAKLMDFGIARMTESHEAMTAAGIVIGTPHYMSPEQVQGRPIDPRSDVYSMGVMMYQMLCGQLPFNSESLTAILTAHITQRPAEPIRLRPEIGREVNSIILRCLEKDPARRYENAGGLLADLDRLQLSFAA